jgi:hypothetical protein
VTDLSYVSGTYVVEITSPGPQGRAGLTGATVESASFTYMGTLASYVGVGRWVFADPAQLLSVQASVNDAPTGSDVIIDVNKNGVSVFTDQADRPRIVAGSHSDVVEQGSVFFDAGDYATIDIDQVGSTNPGSTLVVVVRTRTNP